MARKLMCVLEHHMDLATGKLETLPNRIGCSNQHGLMKATFVNFKIKMLMKVNITSNDIILLLNCVWNVLCVTGLILVKLY